MLRITVELLPLGSETRKEILGVCHIINDGSGTSEKGNYNVAIYEPYLIDAEKFKIGQISWKSGTVKAFPRKKGAWALLHAALRETLDDV